MKRTRKSILTGLLVVMQITNCLAQKSAFTIKGNIKGLKNGTSVYLKSSHEQATGTETLSLTEFVDSCVSYNGIFVFPQVATHHGQRFELSLKGEDKVVTIFSKNKEQIVIKGDAANWPNIKLTGSRGTLDWLTYREGFIPLAMQGNKTVLDEYRMKFIKSNPNSLAAVYIILASNGLTATEKQEAYNRLSAPLRKSYFGKLLPTAIERLKRLEPYMKSGSIPDFKVTDADGNTISVMGSISESKYTLIDFWASWCHPCRAGFPHLKELYAKYKERGLAIIGISIDKDENAWKKAMKEDNISWLNVRDNIEQANRNLFDIVAIPSVLIVDQHGKVVYANIMAGSSTIINGDVVGGERNLDKKIEQLFKTK